MRRIHKPKTRYELFKKVVMLWYRAEELNIRAYYYDRDEKKKQRKELKEQCQEILSWWEDIRL